MARLPRTIALKSKYNDNYLRYLNEASQVTTFVQYSGDSILSPYTKYEVEPSKLDSSLVNIRCSYNNKYWVTSPSHRTYIVAGADKIEEDKSKWNCTLFQPLYDTSHQAYRFRHVFLGFNVCLFRTGPPFENCLVARWSTPDRDLCDLSTIIDWETLLSIPKYVAFKGDNDLYLSARWIEGYRYLQFASDDIGDPSVVTETFITKDGNIRCKSNLFGRFWRRSPNWIWADSTDTTTNNRDTLFWPIKVSNDNVIALRNLGNNNFVKRFTAEGKTSCLNAAVNTIDLFSRLQIEEAVLSRDIYNVRFRPSDSRVYNESVLVMANQSATNSTAAENTMNLSLKYIETTSRMWESFVSLKVSMTTTLQTRIPFIAKGQIEISTEMNGGHTWGETQTTSRELETTYQVTVPPRTTVTVSLVATKGTCDVPFSYTQRDILINGEVKTYEMDDGVYHGMNNYNFRYETK